MIVNQTGGGRAPEKKTTASASDVAKGKTVYLNGDNGLELVAGTYAPDLSIINATPTWGSNWKATYTLKPPSGKKIMYAYLTWDEYDAPGTLTLTPGDSKEIKFYEPANVTVLGTASLTNNILSIKPKSDRIGYVNLTIAAIQG